MTFAAQRVLTRVPNDNQVPDGRPVAGSRTGQAHIDSYTSFWPSGRRTARAAEDPVLNRCAMLAKQSAVRLVVLAFALAALPMISSCDSFSGYGLSAGAPARWGGSSGPPIFIGGPPG